MIKAPTGPGIAAAGQSPWSGLAIWLVLAIALCLYVLLEPPGSPLKRKIRPADLPWHDYGINRLIVMPDGTWQMLRAGYVDRQRRLQIDPAGQLTAYSDDTTPEGIVDVSGGFDVVQRTKELESVISVRPPRSYFKWQQSLRKGANPLALSPLPDPATDADAAPGTTATLQQPLTPPQPRSPLGEKGQVFLRPNMSSAQPPASGVRIQLNQHNQLVLLDLLPGHGYYPDVGDCAAYQDGRLWLTMDRQRNLFRVRITEAHGLPPSVTLEAGRPLRLPGVADHAARLGFQPRQHQLFLVRADGQRFWFNPETLEEMGRDKLPGVWEPEYASYDLRPGPYNGWRGHPLSWAAYARIMQAAMVVFLASLLGLMMLWRPQWKSTSAAITADSSLSSDSEIT